MAATVIECLDTATVAELARVKPSTLDYWVRTGLIKPSLRDTPGRRRTRLWTIKEAIGVRAFAVLRKAGCSLQQIRAAQAAIDGDPALRDANATLVWNGTQVLVVHEDGAVESLLRYPGQLVFRAVALPVGLWSEETDKALSYVWDDELPQGKVYSSRELALAARPPATAAS